MAGDYTRFTFDPLNDFAGVLMQQGRVQLDADWNEMVEILNRRLRAETIDIIGRCIVPKQTPDGFQIKVSGGNLTIGPGRAYVDGLLAENHGAHPLEFDATLDEIRGTSPIAYADQPHMIDPPALPTAIPYLVYLDVWQREVLTLEDADLIEKAIGVDTTTRLQTVWQVKAHSGIGAATTCDTPDDELNGWADLIAPSAGRLTTNAVGAPASDDPCIIAPTGGFRGTENRLYRVEIHNPGPEGTATFKWSRDNATVATNVTAINGDKLTVMRLGRDSVQAFHAGDWVEVSDKEYEMAGQPGIMAKIKSVDEAELTITLTAPIPAGSFPTSGPGFSTDPQRHTRVRRWDQSGPDADANNGLLAVPAASPATPILLEDGVQIAFSTDPAGGQFRAGDYWVFSARTADASVERLDEAPPRGIHHHYCRLAIVTSPETVTDCREFWPPDFRGEGCDCTICVTPESHNSNTLTIQKAIDQVKDKGGKVCLEVGQYDLREPISIRDAQSVQMTGHGLMTVLNYAGSTPAIIIEGSVDVTVEKLSLLTFIRPRQGPSAYIGEARPGVALLNSLRVTIQNCFILDLASFSAESRRVIVPAIGLGGILFQAFIRDNIIAASTGISSMALQPSRTGTRQEVPRNSYLLTFGLFIQDNLLACQKVGISLSGFSIHMSDTKIASNSIYLCGKSGIEATGLVTPDLSNVSDDQRITKRRTAFGSRLDIAANLICVSGNGIIAGTDETRINNNDISALGNRDGLNGITLVSGLDRKEIDRCQILGNRINGMSGHGIDIQTTMNSVMIKNNIIDSIGGAGILMQRDAKAGGLSIENNHLLNVALQASQIEGPAAGIRLINVNSAEVVSNTIVGVGETAVQSEGRDGILAMFSSSLRIAGNHVLDIGPRQFINRSVGIHVFGGFDRTDVVDNVVRRDKEKTSGPNDSQWLALRIIGAFDKEEESTTSVVANPVLLVRAKNRYYAIGEYQVIELPRGHEMTAVRGNMLEGFGTNALIEGDVSGALVFNDNQCLLTTEVNAAGTQAVDAKGASIAGASIAPAVVVIRAEAIIASNNYIQGPRSIAGLDVRVPVESQEQPLFTILGNIVTGKIVVNDSSLGSPWAPLNVIVS